MKFRNIYILIVFMCLLTIFYGCSKVKESTSTTVVTTEEVKEPMNIQTTQLKLDWVTDLNTISIVGMNNDNYIMIKEDEIWKRTLVYTNNLGEILWEYKLELNTDLIFISNDENGITFYYQYNAGSHTLLIDYNGNVVFDKNAIFITNTADNGKVLVEKTDTGYNKIIKLNSNNEVVSEFTRVISNVLVDKNDNLIIADNRNKYESVTLSGSTNWTIENVGRLIYLENGYLAEAKFNKTISMIDFNGNQLWTNNTYKFYYYRGSIGSTTLFNVRDNEDKEFIITIDANGNEVSKNGPYIIDQVYCSLNLKRIDFLVDKAVLNVCSADYTINAPTSYNYTQLIIDGSGKNIYEKKYVDITIDNITYNKFTSDGKVIYINYNTNRTKTLNIETLEGNLAYEIGPFYYLNNIIRVNDGLIIVGNKTDNKDESFIYKTDLNGVIVKELKLDGDFYKYNILTNGNLVFKQTKRINNIYSEYLSILDENGNIIYNKQYISEFVKSPKEIVYFTIENGIVDKVTLNLKYENEFRSN